AAGAIRTRRLALCLLRHDERPPHARPHVPALDGGRVDLGERRHRLRAVQPAQGRPVAGAGGDGAAHVAACSDTDAVHQARRAANPVRLDPVPAGYGVGTRGLRRKDVRPGDGSVTRPPTTQENAMASETQTRTGTCPTHGSVEAAREMPGYGFPFLIN